MSEPKKHHYVPQWVLRNFSFGKGKNKIWVFDKVKGDTRSGAILDVGMQNHFYKYKESGESLESKFFKVIDDAGAVAFSKAQKVSVEGLDEIDKYNLRRFFSAQILRVPARLGSLQRFDEDLRSQLGEEFTVVKKSTHSDFLDSSTKNIDAIERALRAKRMRILVREKHENRFLIGDCPVYWANYGSSSGILHAHGLPVINSDFMAMPLSPFAVLVFYKDEGLVDLPWLIGQNNEWQYINSERFVFSNAKEHLEQGLVRYYELCFDYVDRLSPGLLEQRGVKYGERVDVAPMRIAFSDEVAKKLRDQFGSELKGNGFGPGLQ